jgi:iron complex transport system ATP-binding protein
MKDAAMAALAQVGLEGKAETNYLHLSEGQKQLCILARTLVSSSKLLLLDEPESALDFRFRYQMLSLLRDWVGSGQRSAIVTLHDPSLALNFCDQLLLLSENGILGILNPQVEPLEKTEQMLRQVYGNISLLRCQNRKGESQIVILKEG